MQAENSAAIAWFDAQNFVKIPTFMGESGAAKYCMSMALQAMDAQLWKEAWAGLHQALRRCAALQDTEMAARICFNLGKVYVALGKMELARIMFKHGAHLCQARKDADGLAAALSQLGAVSRELGDVPGCRASWQHALELYQSASSQNAAKLEADLKALPG